MSEGETGNRRWIVRIGGHKEAIMLDLQHVDRGTDPATYTFERSDTGEVMHLRFGQFAVLATCKAAYRDRTLQEALL